MEMPVFDPVSQFQAPSAGTILVVDDESTTRMILRAYLKGAGFDVVEAENGPDALALLDADPQGYDAILLDYMMPQVNGAQVLHVIRQDERFASLAVIFISAASDPERVGQGIEAGAFYYVTKPIDRRTLLPIVRSAVAKRRGQQESDEQTAETTLGISLVTSGEMRIRSLHDAKAAAQYLSLKAANPVPVMVGLLELLINAIEHGNLGIGRQAKAQLLDNGGWAEEVARRLDDPANRDKWVRVSFDRDGTRIKVRIADDGSGFDWKNHMSHAGDDESVGKGIFIARTLAFDHVSYVGDGNVVEVGFTASLSA